MGSRGPGLWCKVRFLCWIEEVSHKRLHRLRGGWLLGVGGCRVTARGDSFFGGGDENDLKLEWRQLHNAVNIPYGLNGSIIWYINYIFKKLSKKTHKVKVLTPGPGSSSDSLWPQVGC